MMKLNKIMFFNILISGTFIAASSYSWFSMWMGLEINMMSMIPLMLNSKDMNSTEASMKYFISQTMASLTILMSLILMSNLLLNKITMLSINTTMNSMFMMKMGAAPLHFWFAEIMEGLSWSYCLMMLTIQKISPMIIIFNNKAPNLLMLTFIISSMMISTIMAFNQTSLRKLLTFSSINHISWMLSSMMNSFMNWILYFSIYSMLTTSMIMLMKNLNIMFINQLNQINFKEKFMLMLTFMSMGGLPPMMGFFPKWITINKLINNQMIMMSLILILTSLMMLFIYLRTMFSSIMFNSMKKKMLNSNYKNKFLSTIMMSMSLYSLPLVTIISNSY